jgi:hypothetical protein
VGVLNHLALFAAMLLLIELIVLILVLLGVAGGLAFGLRWVRGKVGWASGMANTYLGKGSHFLDIGLNYAALPVIKASKTVEMVKATARAVRQRVRYVTGGGETAVQPRPHILAHEVPAPQPSLTSAGTVIEPYPHELTGADTEIKPLPR